MKRLILLLAAITCVACSNNSGSNNDPDTVAPNNVTPNSVVNNATTGAMMLPVLLQQTMDENCLNCHSTGGIGPYDFTDIETVVNLGELIASAVETRTMPPWNMEPSCVDLKGDLRLTEDQIRVFTGWVEAGKPLVPEAPFERMQPKNPDIGDPPAETDEVLEIYIPEPYNPVFARSADYEDDDFRCFAVDPGFTTDRALTGFEALIDNFAVSHHMVVFTADGDDENLAAIAELEAEDPEPGFSCFGIEGFNVNGLSAVWAPGVGRLGLPKRQGAGQTAIPIEAGTVFVIQMHYNKPAVDVGSDQSGVRLWFKEEGSQLNELAEGTWAFVGNMPFRIPAGVDGTGTSDEECGLVYDTANLDGIDGSPPVSPPAVGFASREVRCGLEMEQCESENGAGSADCAIDYGTRLRLATVDLTATYTLTIAGTPVSYDAAAAGATSEADILDGLITAIYSEQTLDGVVTATSMDRDQDSATDEVLVSNVANDPMIRTELFAATGEGEVWRRQVDRCSEYEPARMLEARNVGATGCVQMDFYYRNQFPLTLWSSFGHMHLVGGAIEAEILRSDDSNGVSTPEAEVGECISRTDSWDFDWQRTYWYEETKSVPRNGVVRVRCRYDNSAAEEDVYLGEGSGDEMCLVLLYLTL